MEIQWHGYSCFSVKTKGGLAVVDPYKSDVGFKLPELKADVVVQTNEDSKMNDLKAVKGEPRIFTWPGEYEVCEIAITMQPIAKAEKGKSTPMLVSLNADNIRICYVTDLSIALTDELVESIGNVDILMVPASKEKGGFDKVHEAIEEIEPRIVIPIYYQTPGLKIELDDVAPFLKKAGIATPTTKDKFVVNSKSDLPQEKTEFVVLEPQIG